MRRVPWRDVTNQQANSGAAGGRLLATFAESVRERRLAQPVAPIAAQGHQGASIIALSHAASGPRSRGHVEQRGYVGRHVAHASETQRAGAAGHLHGDGGQQDSNENSEHTLLRTRKWVVGRAR